MNRPAVEVADILHKQGDLFITQSPWLSYQQLSVLRAIRRCRTAALGGHIDRCSQCDHQAISYNSCRNRHCPKCQAQARQRWINAREKDLLEVPYFHVVFTLPHELNRLCQRNPALLYGLLFSTSAASMLEVAANPKRLGAQIGFVSILHTWGQNLSLHPHVHCVVPGGGLTADRKQWIAGQRSFFLPVKVLSRVFRGKFVEGLRQAYDSQKLNLPAALTDLHNPKQFNVFVNSLFQQDWIIYAKPAFGGPAQVLRYLGRYTHRVAINNHRLLAFDGDRVTFRWKDYAHGNKQRVMTLTATDFLRRFTQHILPRAFVRIRHFGFLANAQRANLLSIVRHCLAADRPQLEELSTIPERQVWLCPQCGTEMTIGTNLSAAQLVRCRAIDSS